MRSDLSATALPLSAAGATGETTSPMTSQGHNASVKVVPLNESASAHAGKEVLKLEGISLAFGGVKALADVDLSVRAGEIRAIIGPNGAGKSTLLNVICGLYRPNSGRIHLCGEDFSSVPTKRLAHLGVSRTFQNIALFKGLSVFDNIAAGRVGRVYSTVIEQIFGVGRARRENEATRVKVEEALEHMRLSGVRDRMATSLSYGMQKRVELARALVIEPKLILLDEPMAGVTAAEKTEMSQLIREARDRFGTTIVLIEHDIGVVMGLSDRISVLDYGRKIADGTPSQVMNDRAVIDAYLGVPHENAN